MPLFGKAKTVVGLDIGSSAVKAVELKPSGKGYKVTRSARSGACGCDR
jgi:Tfp pilus assembly PilM family ATPase